MVTEFNLSEKIRELDLKIMNDEISLLVYLNLRNELEKEFIKLILEDVYYHFPTPSTQKLFLKIIKKRAGKNLI